MAQITFIIFLIILTIKVSESVTCVNPEGKAVKWWIHLADADSASQENMYARGLYYDSLLGLEWYHDQGGENRVIDNSVIYHGHVKVNIIIPQQLTNTSIIIKSLMPELKSTGSGLYEKGSGVQPSQHAFCNSLTGKPDLVKYFDILQNTKAVFVRSKDDCRYFQPELTLKAPLDKCDKKWRKYVNRHRFRDEKNDGDLILKKLFTKNLLDEDSYTTTKKYCMENEGPFTLGSFTTFSFSADKENDKKNYKAFSKCFALNYGKEIKNYIKLEKDHFSKNSWFEKQDPIKVEMLSMTHCLSNDDPIDDSICYDAKTDPYLLVAQHYNSHFFVSTDQETFPSLIGSTFSIRNIVTWSPLWSREKKDGKNAESRSRHEKLMVSKSKNIICLGDSNRNDYSVHHAGTIFCIENEILAKRVYESIGSFNLYRQFNFGNIDIKNSPFEDVKPVCYLYAQSLYHPIAKVSVDMKFFERKGSIPLTNSNITPGEPSKEQKKFAETQNTMKGIQQSEKTTIVTRKRIKDLKTEYSQIILYFYGIETELWNDKNQDVVEFTCNTTTHTLNDISLQMPSKFVHCSQCFKKELFVNRYTAKKLRSAGGRKPICVF
ncbi:hypothetical protein PPL_05386 [Heterostelium album PN500]|uniref:Uncharacterized protein n=1 Tax=Heterostelium pallidum (strain ATCC 26659 / Pp 5 / PN500) TaxID=670386 RepID=D3BA14_HETP5|nr:hypothetical protein PPL_05386 [Heterostelium album PN500]EFA81401.1 hypothetical protein PPL_05386 [Heterostelium album PN500]|eukprot:XP_020433519.1 hypothetical protein PPL_05386 [Heterostelium album PN500]